mgnify:CR=1 FL=1
MAISKLSKFSKLAGVSILLLSSNLALAKDWRFQIEPYMMATSIEGDATMGRASGVPLDVDFSTILDNLDMAAMIHGEVHHRSGWGFVVDYGFMDLSQKKTNNREGIVKANLRQGVLESFGLYRMKHNLGHLDYFVGVRWWDNDVKVTLDPAISPGSTTLQVKEDWVDLMAGVRWMSGISKNWNFQARADIGGFGVEADFTSSVEAGVTYKISNLMTLDMKYRALWVDFDNTGNTDKRDDFHYDTITHGPILGLVFNF